MLLFIKNYFKINHKSMRYNFFKLIHYSHFTCFTLKENNLKQLIIFYQPDKILNALICNHTDIPQVQVKGKSNLKFSQTAN